MRPIKLMALVAGVVAGLVWGSAARADAIRYRPGDPIPSPSFERILNYHSDIVINRDASLTVTETIQVNATGRQIRQGIYRDFPTTYRGAWKLRTEVGFKVLEIRRDGHAEPWFTRSLSNGVRIYIGRRGAFLRRGLHTYVIKYRTTRQLGFFPGYDELYWNVTGNGWTFAMDKVEAVVTLPPGAVVKARSAYTGRFGAKGRDWYAVDAGAGKVGFTTSKRLFSGAGLTIGVAWQKGLVPAPTGAQRTLWLLEDNLPAVILAFTFLALFAYYVIAWVIVGRDPPRGAIVPRYEPPAGFSPAAVRYVTKTTYDRKAFSAALIDMAVKGFLRIKQTSDTTFILDKEPHANKGALSTGERAIAAELFRKKPQVRLNRKYKASVKRALSSHEEKVRADYDDGYFLRNRGYRMVGLAMAVVGMLIAGLVAAEFAPAFFLAIGVAVCVWVLLTFAFSFVRALAGGPRIGAAVGSLVMVAIALVAGAAAGVFLSDAISTPGALVAALVGATTFFFDEWLKAPTRVGRKILDQIEGLKMYMTVAEKDRLNLINPPDRTPETFERLLPYALALDVEQRWSEQFSDILAAASQEPGQAGYQPIWYTPLHNTDFADLSFTDSLGNSLSSTISASATPPGSSSGSGGGGFSGGGSGGGGGGGGGGGW